MSLLDEIYLSKRLVVMVANYNVFKINKGKLLLDYNS